MGQEVANLFARLVDIEKAHTCGIESRQDYLAMHGPRFATILRTCKLLVSDSSARVLDIGRSELTAYLSTFYRDIHTLGLDPQTDDGGHRETQDLKAVPHITFDLLSAPFVASWPECGTFDLIVFSEVIEHLHVAPAFVLAFLRSLLSPSGVLVCTTPNAVEITKRIRLLAGRNPYEQLRLYPGNPGHVREYTQDELVTIAKSAGLNCSSHSFNDWISGKNGGIKAAIRRILSTYPPLRQFQMFTFVRSESFSLDV